MATVLEVPINIFGQRKNLVPFSGAGRPPNYTCVIRKNKSFVPIASSSLTPVQYLEEKTSLVSQNFTFPIMVNSCTGKMGKSVIEAAFAAGLDPVPVSFSRQENSGKTIEIEGKEFQLHGPSERENILASVLEEYPGLIVVDYSTPTAVNDNAELYCKLGVPFVMGTTGGNRERLYKTVEDTKNYAVISPQMGKQVVAFLAAMEYMAEQFPGAYSGYTLQIQQIRDPNQQIEMVGVPEEYLSGHAFHMYHLTSPDETVSFEFQHNVCGRSIYAEGSVDAAFFLAKKIRSKADKRLYNMIDVLREGSMR